MARAYGERLVHTGNHKAVRGIRKRMDVHKDRICRFIIQSPWDHDALQDHLNHTIPDSLTSTEAMLIFDDVDFRRKDNHNVGVVWQYAGSIGKVDNCHVAVDLVSVFRARPRTPTK